MENFSSDPNWMPSSSSNPQRRKRRKLSDSSPSLQNEELLSIEKTKDTTISRRGLFGLLKSYLILEDKPKGKMSDIPPEEKLRIFRDAVGNIIKGSLSDNEQKVIINKVTKDMTKYEEKQRQCDYKPFRFEKHNSVWANAMISLPPELFMDNSSLNSNPLPPDLGTCNSSFTRTEYRHIRNLSDAFTKEDRPLPVALKVAARLAGDTGESSMKKILEDLARNPCNAYNIDLAMKSRTGELKPYTPDEALALVLRKNLSKDTYCFLQSDLRLRGYKVFPQYRSVLRSKQECRPAFPVYANEIEAFLPLESLLRKTTERIVKLQGESLIQYVATRDKSVINCIMECSWGFDGSTGHSVYQQKLASDQDDHSLIATTVIPLQLRTSDKKHILWCNPAPQSPNYCRPLHLQFRKETHELVRNEYDWVNEQITELEPFNVNILEGRNLLIHFNMNFSIIDGKVLGIISGTASQNCPYCQAKPTEMNQIEKVCQKSVNKDLLNCGLSPLHAWIRVLEFLLNLGYKNHPKLRRWSVRKKSLAGKLLKRRKASIRQKIRNTMGLIVDQVKPGGSGTTNDGNTARRALSDSNRKAFSKILGLQQWLLDSLHTILTIISSGLPIAEDRFGEFCINLARRYVQNYNWYYMPVTVHKLLVHGKEIIQASSLPVGFLSEQAGESRNKLYKRFRAHHTRKFDRKCAMLDLFHRSWDSSDPYLCDIFQYEKQKHLKRWPLSTDAMKLLKPFEVASDPDEEDYEDETDYETEETPEDNPSYLENEIEDTISSVDPSSC